MRSVDISKLFEDTNNSSSPCGVNPQYGDVPNIPPSESLVPPTTSGPVTLSSCIVLLNYGESLYAYNPNNNKNVYLGNFIPGGGDIASTTNKLWFYNGTMIYEYDMQLSPFYAQFNRTIDTALSVNNLYTGLHAVDNLTLIVSDSNSIPNRIVTLDITRDLASETSSFDLPLGKYISGDIILTKQNKVILTTDGGRGNCFLYQYDYATGTQEVAVDLGPLMIYPYGLFQWGDYLYIMSGAGKMVKISLDAPYTLTDVYDTDLPITGTSQNRDCITKSLNV